MRCKRNLLEGEWLNLVFFALWLLSQQIWFIQRTEVTKGWNDCFLHIVVTNLKIQWTLDMRILIQISSSEDMNTIHLLSCSHPNHSPWINTEWFESLWIWFQEWLKALSNYLFIIFALFPFKLNLREEWLFWTNK